VIDKVLITIVGGFGVEWVSIVVIVNSVVVCGSTIGLSCLGFGCIAVLGSVGGMVRLVVGDVAVGVQCLHCRHHHCVCLLLQYCCGKAMHQLY